MKKLAALMVMLFFALSVSPVVMWGGVIKENKGKEYTLLAKKDKKKKKKKKKSDNGPNFASAQKAGIALS